VIQLISHGEESPINAMELDLCEMYRRSLPDEVTRRQPENRPRVPSQGSFSAALGLQLAGLGRQVAR
jgi:hypothetical protein